jgi:four helix bundle protein
MAAPTSSPVTFEDLRVWQLAMELACRVYEITRQFPAAERYGLVAQCRRAAASVPCNIAEGAARRTSAEFVQFLYVARGSLSELRTLLLLAARLQICDESAECQETIATVGRMLNRLIAAETGGSRK